MSTTLASLPRPSIVEELSFEAILAAIKADFLTRYPEAAEVLELESEPIVKLMESFAYRELLYRARVNDAARAHLLAFATGGDLDHIGALVGAQRMAGEADERYRLRIQLRIAALAAQGTKQHYEFVAMTASSNVRAAHAMQPAAGKVHVIVWLHDQVQADATRTTVAAALNADDARMLGVDMTVSTAVPRAINITANITMASNAPAGLISMLHARLQTAFQNMPEFGASIARSYITTLLHTDGVAAVTYPDDAAPAPITVLALGEFPALGVVNLNDTGAV